MTALAGFWSLSGGAGSANRCRAMLAAQARYGSRQSEAEPGDIALGVRLHPLLPEDSFDAQPLIGGGGRFALVADLRLDNRDELAGALGLTPSERAASADSALLLRALERWGEAAPERLLGDFAFAFWDALERRLLLGRDPLGQRPLFWHRGGHFVAFATMPSGLHALPEVGGGPDPTSLMRHLAGLPRTGPASFHRDIERVEPGHLVAITPDRATRSRYWRPRRRTLGLRSFEDHVEAFRGELDSAVARRLRGAGDPVAAHLSGGWDSNAVTATAARLLLPDGGRVLAFTHLPGPGASGRTPYERIGDEGPLAEATARLYPNVEHVRLRGSGRSPLAELDLYSDLFQRPVFNLCNHVWLSEIRSAARAAGAKILLSGEIGNWTVSAAPTALLADFVREGRWLAWSREAGAMIRSGRARLRGVAAASFGPWLPDALWKRLGRFSSGLDDSLTGPIHPRLRTLVAAERAWRGGRRSYFDEAAEALMEMDWGEHRKGILAGWGIDKRDPTADTRLIDFCLSLPLDMLMNGGVRRPLARAALSDRVAPAVLAEPRKGYQSADWHVGLSRDRSGVARLLDSLAAHPEAAVLIDVEGLRALVEAWPEGGWDDPRVMGAYRIGLLKALTVGHFILAAGR